MWKRLRPVREYPVIIKSPSDFDISSSFLFCNYVFRTIFPQICFKSWTHLINQETQSINKYYFWKSYDLESVLHFDACDCTILWIILVQLSSSDLWKMATDGIFLPLANIIERLRLLNINKSIVLKVLEENLIHCISHWQWGTYCGGD